MNLSASTESTPDRLLNMSEHLGRRAQQFPDRSAIISPGRSGGGRAGVGAEAGWRITTFGELETRVAHLATGLAKLGVRNGMRCAVFVRPSAELIALVYALFRLGAVPVVADPGMGRKRLLAALEEVQPEVFVGIPRAHAARKLFPKAFKNVHLAVTVGARLFWGGKTLVQVEKIGRSARNSVVAQTKASDPAAILFTSGSTGPPKGVVYTHGMFDAQVQALDALYQFEEGEVDLAGLPLFALFDVAFGMTSVFPPLDPSHPGQCDPKAIYDAIETHGVTTAFGSPAIWRRVVPWCIEQGYALPQMKRILCAGAPVPPDLIGSFHRVLSVYADVHTPYGATEALPVSTMAGRDVVPALLSRTNSGDGTCIGVPREGMRVALIRIQDGPIEVWDPELEVAQGEIGEVCVQGDSVTAEYFKRPSANAHHKIHEDADSSPLNSSGDGVPPGAFWHRMGDAARFDEEGRLWFQGRLAHRLQTESGTVYPVPVENVFNTHERVFRSALVGVGEPGAEVPVLVVEPLKGELPGGQVMRDGFIMQLKNIGAKSSLTRDLEHFLFRDSFPVDVRHNAKIHRDELKVWATTQLGK